MEKFSTYILMYVPYILISHFLRWSSCRANIEGQGAGLVAVKGWLDENDLLSTELTG